MTIAEILQAAAEPLKAWTSQQKGRVEIAGDLGGLFRGVYQLSLKPGGVHVFLVALSETNRSGHPEYARTDMQIAAVISRGQTFSFAKADSLTVGAAGGRPLYDLAEEMREVIRGIRLAEPADEPMFLYTGFNTFDPGEVILDAFQYNFTVARDLPEQFDQVEEA